jgi:ATP-binding cassette subfamily B protein
MQPKRLQDSSERRWQRQSRCRSLERAVDDPSIFLVPPRAAYTPQVPKLFSMSLEDNLGQIQRSAAARLLTRSPQLLVLDDVSSALDVETKQTLWRRLSEARSDIAALVVSHRHAAVSRADRVIGMDRGKVVAVGTASDLAQSSETFLSIWEGALTATGG